MLRRHVENLTWLAIIDFRFTGPLTGAPGVSHCVTYTVNIPWSSLELFE